MRVAVTVADGKPPALVRVAVTVADGKPPALVRVAVTVADCVPAALRVLVADNVPTALVADADIVPIGVIILDGEELIVPAPCKFLILS